MIAQAADRVAGLEQWHIERLAIEGHGGVEALEQFAEAQEHFGFVAVVAEDVLLRDQFLALDPRRADEKGHRAGAAGQAGGLRIEKEALFHGKALPRSQPFQAAPGQGEQAFGGLAAVCAHDEPTALRHRRPCGVPRGDRLQLCAQTGGHLPHHLLFILGAQAALVKPWRGMSKALT